jgi:hypothetical protein
MKFASIDQMLKHGHDAHGYPDPAKKCEVCGDPKVPAACAGCARRDLEGMREFQAKFIKSDHERRDLELQVREEQKKADGYMAVLGAIRAVLILDKVDKMSPELRKALWLDQDTALDLQRVRREVVEAAKELKGKERWPYLDVGGGRLAHALLALEKVEAARVEKGLPLETRITE